MWGQQLRALDNWNLDHTLTALISIHNANLATIRQWEKYLEGTALPDLATAVDAYREPLTASKDTVRSELEKKQKDPNAEVDLSAIDGLSEGLDALRTVTDEYNREVATFTEKARQYVTNLPKSDVGSIREALVKQQEIKKRFAAEWTAWATGYTLAKTEADSFQTQRNDKQKELEDQSSAIFSIYEARLNQLLSTLGADFTITGLTGKTDERANESYSDFGFIILQQSVPLTSRQDDAPCFKNTLSEGDKSTLAFAFFVAVLEKMPDLSNQIVIFDDPLSSLDETRREATARLLLGLSSTVKQLAVFTHKRDFLYMLCDKMPSNKTLQFRSDRTNGSTLAVLDVDEERKGDHARLIEGMERYLVEDFGPTPETMQSNLRKLFETVLKTKYYRALASDIKAKHGLATLLTTLFNAGLLDLGLKAQLFDVCSVANGTHHGEIVDATPRKLTRGRVTPANA